MRIRCKSCWHYYFADCPTPRNPGEIPTCRDYREMGTKEDEKEGGDMNALAALIAALIMVESGGDNLAIGKDGKSYGPMQITDICREDVNRIAHTHYTREDCFDRDKSVEMFHVYIAHYCTPARLGRDPRWEDVARIWNGGLDGWKEPETGPYWQKVRKELEKQT